MQHVERKEGDGSSKKTRSARVVLLVNLRSGDERTIEENLIEGRRGVYCAKE